MYFYKIRLSLSPESVVVVPLATSGPSIDGILNADDVTVITSANSRTTDVYSDGYSYHLYILNPFGDPVTLTDNYPNADFVSGTIITNQYTLTRLGYIGVPSNKYGILIEVNAPIAGDSDNTDGKRIVWGGADYNVNFHNMDNDGSPRKIQQILDQSLDVAPADEVIVSSAATVNVALVGNGEHTTLVVLDGSSASLTHYSGSHQTAWGGLQYGTQLLADMITDATVITNIDTLVEYGYTGASFNVVGVLISSDVTLTGGNTRNRDRVTVTIGSTDHVIDVYAYQSAVDSLPNGWENYYTTSPAFGDVTVHTTSDFHVAGIEPSWHLRTSTSHRYSSAVGDNTNTISDIRVIKNRTLLLAYGAVGVYGSDDTPFESLTGLLFKVTPNSVDSSAIVTINLEDASGNYLGQHNLNVALDLVPVLPPADRIIIEPNDLTIVAGTTGRYLYILQNSSGYTDQSYVIYSSGQNMGEGELISDASDLAELGYPDAGNDVGVLFTFAPSSRGVSSYYGRLYYPNGQSGSFRLDINILPSSPFITYSPSYQGDGHWTRAHSSNSNNQNQTYHRLFLNLWDGSGPVYACHTGTSGVELCPAITGGAGSWSAQVVTDPDVLSDLGWNSSRFDYRSDVVGTLVSVTFSGLPDDPWSEHSWKIWRNHNGHRNGTELRWRIWRNVQQ